MKYLACIIFLIVAASALFVNADPIPHRYGGFGGGYGGYGGGYGGFGGYGGGRYGGREGGGFYGR